MKLLCDSDNINVLNPSHISASLAFPSVSYLGCRSYIAALSFLSFAMLPALDQSILAGEAPVKTGTIPALLWCCSYSHQSL